MSRAVPVASGTADVQGYTGATTVMAFSVTAAAATIVSLRDGTSAAGPVIATVRLAGAGTQHVILPAVEVATGIFVDRDAVASELVLYLF